VLSSLSLAYTVQMLGLRPSPGKCTFAACALSARTFSAKEHAVSMLGYATTSLKKELELINLELKFPTKNVNPEINLPFL